MRVNQDATFLPQNETSIAVNRLNPLNLVGGANDYRIGDGNSHCGFYASTNAGQSWTDGLISRLGFQTAGDPAVAFDRTGTVYFACLHFNRTDGASLISVSKSVNGGRTFGLPVAVVSGTGMVDLHDKPYLAVDATGGPFDGTVYVSWTRFTAVSADINVARSTNGGTTWSAPTPISDTPLNQGSVPAVGPNGEVYVVWQDFAVNRILLDRSVDGGATFGPDRTVANIVPIADPLGGFGWQFRANTFPTVAVDTTAGLRRGTIYVAWADQHTGDADILLVRSTNGGLTWSAPVRVNDDPIGNGRHQVFPWASVDPQGNVHVVWYDNRDGTGALLRLFAARSGDGGATFSANEAVSDAPFNPSIQFMGRFIGDYNGLASSTALVHALWTDSRAGHQDIFTARRPATDGPAVALGISRARLRVGEQLIAGLVGVNAGMPRMVDVLLGLLLPDRRTIVFRGPTGALVRGDLSRPATYVAAISGLTLGTGFELIAPDVIGMTATAGDPTGEWVIFLALASPGAFLDGRVNPGDIVSLDFQTFSLDP